MNKLQYPDVPQLEDLGLSNFLVNSLSLYKTTGSNLEESDKRLGKLETSSMTYNKAIDKNTADITEMLLNLRMLEDSLRKKDKEIEDKAILLEQKVIALENRVAALEAR